MVIVIHGHYHICNIYKLLLGEKMTLHQSCPAILELYMNKFTLEKYRAFPIVAWLTVICFAGFVFHIVTSLAQGTQELGVTNNRLENLVHQPVESITDFGH